MDAGRKAVSVVISALVVTVIFLGLVSVSMTSLYLLQNSAADAVKREAEKAMESFFQIYWLNDTHVRLFNNHSSVPITLLHWISYDPSAGYQVFSLNSVDYTVPPGAHRDLKNFQARSALQPLNRVVSSRGSVFEVTDAPSELHTLIYFTPTERIVRPGFNGRATTFVITTGPDFGGGDVSIQCVNIFYVDGNVFLPCSVWSVSFSPSSGLVNVQPGRTSAIGVNIVVPTSGTGSSTGFYYIRLRLVSQSFTREYSARVIVSDFSVQGLPASVNLGRAGCFRSVLASVTTINSYTGRIVVQPIPDPAGLLNIWASPNPVDPVADSTFRIFVERIWSGPLGVQVNTITLLFRDGLGVDRTGSIVVTHRGSTALARLC